MYKGDKMKCNVSFCTGYEKECPENDECVWWRKEGCMLKRMIK